jgi:hypothetical protein
MQWEVWRSLSASLHSISYYIFYGDAVFVAGNLYLKHLSKGLAAKPLEENL